EDRLSHLFREIEERIAEGDRVAEEERIAAEKAEEAARRQGEERERRWHALMREARQGLVDSYRASHLRSEAERWTYAENARRYCDAVEVRYGGRVDTADWLKWARACIARIDPLNNPPVIPDDPEATPEALQEHLPEGWSARGPAYSDPRSHVGRSL